MWMRGSLPFRVWPRFLLGEVEGLEGRVCGRGWVDFISCEFPGVVRYC